MFRFFVFSLLLISFGASGAQTADSGSTYWDKKGYISITIRNKSVQDYLIAEYNSFLKSKISDIPDDFEPQTDDDFLGTDSYIFFVGNKIKIIGRKMVTVSAVRITRKYGESDTLSIISNINKYIIKNNSPFETNYENMGHSCEITRRGLVKEYSSLMNQVVAGYGSYIENSPKKASDDVINGISEEDYLVADCGRGWGVIIVSSKRSYGTGISVGGNPEAYSCGANVIDKSKPAKFLNGCYRLSDFWEPRNYRKK